MDAFDEVDFILKTNVNSLDDWHEFARFTRSKIENNIRVLNTTFVLKVIKHTSENYIYC